MKLYAILFLLYFTLGQNTFADAPKEKTLDEKIRKGEKLWLTTCAKCHNLKSPLDYPSYAWELVVFHMRLNAILTKREQDLILTYLQNSSDSNK